MRELFDEIYGRLSEDKQNELDWFIYRKHDLDRERSLDASLAHFTGWAIELYIDERIQKALVHDASRIG